MKIISTKAIDMETKKKEKQKTPAAGKVFFKEFCKCQVKTVLEMLRTNEHFVNFL